MTVAELDAMTITQQRAHAVLVNLTACPYNTSAEHEWLYFVDSALTRCVNCKACFYR